MDPADGATIRGEGIGRLSVQRSQAARSVFLEIHGELDLASGAAIDRELGRAQDLTPLEIVIDLSGLTFMDSTGVRVLIGAWRHAERNRYALRLRRLPSQARRVLEMSGALELFDVSD